MERFQSKRVTCCCLCEQLPNYTGALYPRLLAQDELISLWHLANKNHVPYFDVLKIYAFCMAMALRTILEALFGHSLLKFHIT